MKHKYSKHEIWLAGHKAYRRLVWQKRLVFLRKHWSLITIGATASFGSVALVFWRAAKCLS